MLTILEIVNSIVNYLSINQHPCVPGDSVRGAVPHGRCGGRGGRGCLQGRRDGRRRA